MVAWPMPERPAHWREHVNLLLQTFSESAPDSHSSGPNITFSVFDQSAAEPTYHL